MSSATKQTVIIVISIAAAIIITVCICIIIFKGSLPFTFSRRQTPTSRFDAANDLEQDLTEGVYKNYGKLYVAPDKQPTVAALDIMTRILICPCLPGSAKIAMSEKRTGTLPHVSVQRLDLKSGVSSPSVGAGELAQKNERCCFDERETRRSFKAERIRAGQWAIVEKESIWNEDDEIVLDPRSFSFGSGKSIAELYRKQW
ncbi:hypothetical protein BDU57DRAFT_581590 [Ampelomyces quisqualis]|uniref:Uncharacterized protein n=1 Tax=Ampelomyces quisqualis TaxID=50730 RepID=A0A6A5QF03_AMPQU|nr:hypothetical protein BDU57DRAFT_581590 [Ampelomyces quisqualis]